MAHSCDSEDDPCGLLREKKLRVALCSNLTYLYIEYNVYAGYTSIIISNKVEFLVYLTR